MQTYSKKKKQIISSRQIVTQFESKLISIRRAKLCYITMLPFPRRVFKISVLKLKLWKRHENTKLSKYSICKENDNENSSSKY